MKRDLIWKCFFFSHKVSWTSLEAVTTVRAAKAGRRGAEPVLRSVTPSTGCTQSRYEESSTNPSRCFSACSCHTQYSQARTFSLIAAGARAAVRGRHGLATAFNLFHLFPSFVLRLKVNYSESNSEHTKNSYIPSSFTKSKTWEDYFGLSSHKMRIRLICSTGKLLFGLVSKNA